MARKKTGKKKSAKKKTGRSRGQPASPVPAAHAAPPTAAPVVGLFDQYWQTRMRSAEQRLEAALQLINHNVTRGTLAEAVVREVIDAFLPGGWTTSSGFVLHRETREPSKQIDVLVYDRLRGTPIYSDENIVVLFPPNPGDPDTPGSPGIAVEVKSTVESGDLLNGALENIASFKGNYEGQSGIGGSIYAFRGFAQDETLRDHLQAHVDAVDPSLWPDTICIQYSRRIVTRIGGAIPSLQCRESSAPVIQSLLTTILNALGVPGTTEFLPQPKLGEVLFEVKRG